MLAKPCDINKATWLICEITYQIKSHSAADINRNQHETHLINDNQNKVKKMTTPYIENIKNRTSIFDIQQWSTLCYQ